ncbi:phosphotransferase family protein [Candidatus Poriferisodalis sp.]|uniref:phosphotransferase family protein n=1 Tax=Candidatus Poriferisodalis sp. TaxID=3101277 RepID=UPI003B012D2F
MQDSPTRATTPEALAGRVTEFIRFGNTVRRPATASSASVRQLLVDLEEAGFGGAPRYLGTEPDGWMVLSWVKGWVLAAGRRRAPLGGEAAGVLSRLRRGVRCGLGLRRGPQAVGPGQVVCHGDIAARNTVFAGGRAAAFIDWDPIFVASPMWDLAHAVWQFAPVCGELLVGGDDAQFHAFCVAECLPVPADVAFDDMQRRPVVDCGAEEVGGESVDAGAVATQQVHRQRCVRPWVDYLENVRRRRRRVLDDLVSDQSGDLAWPRDLAAPPVVPAQHSQQSHIEAPCHRRDLVLPIGTFLARQGSHREPVVDEDH